MNYQTFFKLKIKNYKRWASSSYPGPRRCLSGESRKGLTLIELIVVMTIATIIMTSLVVQQGKWNDELAVRTQAYELALMIRQAQIYSLGVREDTGGAGGDKFNIGYGMHIDTRGAANDRYIFFADRDGDKKYSGSGEDIENKVFTRGVTVNKVCNGSLSIPLPSNCGTGPSAARAVDISFFRPLPNAYIKFLDNGGSVVPLSPPAFLKVQSAGGQTVVIKVETNGQISIQ